MSTMNGLTRVAVIRESGYPVGRPTPGPWVVTQNPHTDSRTNVGNGDYGSIADTVGRRPSREENEANARLIAQAPAMRKALSEGMEWLYAEFCSVAQPSMIVEASKLMTNARAILKEIEP